MDPLHATIEEFAAEGYTHVEAKLPVVPLHSAPAKSKGFRKSRWGCEYFDASGSQQDAQNLENIYRHGQNRMSKNIDYPARAKREANALQRPKRRYRLSTREVGSPHKRINTQTLDRKRRDKQLHIHS